MIQFVCDSCGSVKGAKEPWILGVAAELVGVTSTSREITIFPTWDPGLAAHLLAVHFCSSECKDEYTAQVMEDDMPEPAAARKSARGTVKPAQHSSRGTQRSTRRRRRAA